MTTKLFEDYDFGIIVTKFYGGKDRGVCRQLSVFDERNEKWSSTVVPIKRFEIFVEKMAKSLDVNLKNRIKNQILEQFNKEIQGFGEEAPITKFHIRVLKDTLEKVFQDEKFDGITRQSHIVSCVNCSHRIVCSFRKHLQDAREKCSPVDESIHFGYENNKTSLDWINEFALFCLMYSKEEG